MVEFVGNDAHRTGEIVMDVTAGFWTSLGALVLLSMLLGAVITVVDSVLSTIQASGIIKKIPIVGTNWNLIVAIAMMAVIDIDVVGGWGVGSDSWDQWTLNGTLEPAGVCRRVLHISRSIRSQLG